MKNFIHSLSVVALSTLLTTSVNAQISYPYVLDFENTTPSTKSYAGTDTVAQNNLRWVMPGVYLGSPITGSDFYNDTKSCRMRLTNNSTGTPGYLEMVDDLPLGADSLTLQAAMYSTNTGDSLLIEYSTNQGSTWTMLGSAIPITGTVNSPQTIALKPGISSPVRFKFTKVSTVNLRVNLDDITITQGAQATNLMLMSFSPTGSVHPATDVMTMTFDEDVNKGIGNITLYKVGGSATAYDVATSTDVDVINNVVTISNIALDASSEYYVMYDSTAFTGVSSSLNAMGIYDSTTWMFTTTATSLQSFEETMDDCNAPMFGVFKAESIEGTDVWYCDTYNDSLGSYDPPYATINGGNGSASYLNEDYLVTSIPVDLSGMSIEEINLYYSEKRRFGGDGVTRGIYYSADYTGDAGSATWTAIDDNLADITTTGVFVNRSLNITSLIDTTQPVYLAFVYSSIEDTTSRNWAWSLDDIELEVKEGSTSINPLKTNDIYMNVMGTAKSHKVNVRISSTEDLDNAGLTIYDINGRTLYTEALNIKAGTQVKTIEGINLTTGMYVIKLDSHKGSKIVKFISE